MEKKLYESLTDIKEKYKKLNEALIKPDVVNNIKEYNKINMEVKMIEDVVECFDEYLLIEKSIKDAEDILATEKDVEMIDMAKMELEDSKNQVPVMIDKLKLLLIPKDPNDDKNVIVEIRGAAGGDEANIFAGDLYDMYKRYAVEQNMKITLIELQKSQAGGFTIVVFKVVGDKTYSKWKFESGVHRVQRIPATETQGRVHTSTATVTVMPEADETVDIEIKPADLKIDTYRAGGAGGQHVNTTDSAVRITHVPSGIIVASQEGRSQLSNREVAMTMLRTKLYEQEIIKKQETDSSFRKLAGSGARSEKIRTYNYPQDRVTDHRIGLSMSLKTVIEGKLDNIINGLFAKEQSDKISDAGL